MRGFHYGLGPGKLAKLVVERDLLARLGPERRNDSDAFCFQFAQIGFVGILADDIGAVEDWDLEFFEMRDPV